MINELGDACQVPRIVPNRHIIRAQETLTIMVLYDLSGKNISQNQNFNKDQAKILFLNKLIFITFPYIFPV